MVAAHHRVHVYACCHLQADCLESGISSSPYARLWVWVPLHFTFYCRCRILKISALSGQITPEAKCDAKEVEQHSTVLAYLCTDGHALGYLNSNISADSLYCRPYRYVLYQEMHHIVSGLGAGSYYLQTSCAPCSTYYFPCLCVCLSAQKKTEKLPNKNWWDLNLAWICVLVTAWQGCGVLAFLWDSDSRVRKSSLGFQTPILALKTWTRTPGPKSDSDSDSRTYCVT